MGHNSGRLLDCRWGNILTPSQETHKQRSAATDEGLHKCWQGHALVAPYLLVGENLALHRVHHIALNTVLPHRKELHRLD